MVEYHPYHYETGLQFLMEQTRQAKDWATFIKMMEKVNDEHMGQLRRLSEVISSPPKSPPPPALATKSPCRKSRANSRSSLGGSPRPEQCQVVSTSASSSTDRHTWCLWRWKPPVRSPMQSRDDYFHKPPSTPHSIMNQFKKHLSMSKDLKFGTQELRRMAAIEFTPLMTFVSQDDYDDHTDSIVRSYFIFKEGVMPLWEDKSNAFGGCWSLLWVPGPNHSRRNTSRFVWKKLIQMLTDPIMADNLDEICGAGLTIRANQTYKITVWNRDSSNGVATMMIGQIIQSMMEHEGPMFYHSHNTTLKKEYSKKAAVIVPPVPPPVSARRPILFERTKADARKKTRKAARKLAVGLQLGVTKPARNVKDDSWQPGPSSSGTATRPTRFQPGNFRRAATNRRTFQPRKSLK